MDAWSTKLEPTWLNSPEACRELDEKIAQLMASHWNLPRHAMSPAIVATLLPMRCEPTAAAIKTLGGSPSSSIHCTILLALLGELLLCAEEGGILRKDTVARIAGAEAEGAVAPDAVRLLRNAVCHPASALEHDEETGIRSFADFVTHHFKRETWASSLRIRPGELAKREVAFFALQLANDIGWERANRWGLKLKGAKRSHPR